MKNFNFIKRLWVDSHEKHLPQRFGHYAAMLFLFLTLGFGQAWGANRTYDGSTLLFWNLAPTSASWWNDASRAHSIQFLKTDDTWTDLVSPTVIKDGKAGYIVPSGTYKAVKFCSNWNNGGAVNYTGAIEFDADASKDYVSNFSENGTSAEWSTNTMNVVKAGDVIYFSPTTGDNGWTKDGARFAVYLYNDLGNAWTGLTQIGTSGVYYAIIPAGAWPMMIFCRMNGSTSENNWDNKWDQLSDVAPHATYNQYVQTAWTTASWNAVYAPPLSAVSLSDNGTTILAGTGIESDPYLIATSSTIEVIASGTEAVPDPDATIYYNIKDNTTSKQNSTTDTYSFTASSTANTIHQMKVDGYTKVGSTSSTEMTSSTIYYKTVDVKDISVYIYVGGCTDGQINSLVLTANPYVDSKALPGVNIPAASFTTDGNWRKYTFTNVSEVQHVVVARENGRAVDDITITDDIYYKYDGTELSGKCIARTTPTWNVAPANGAIGGSMTATVSDAPTGATITWTSTNESAATVNSSGVISYVAAGNTTIKARVQKAAGDDYCALDETISQAITVTSGATVSVERTCPQYVSTESGQVTLHITSTGAGTGWKYRIYNTRTGGYQSPDNVDASSNGINWTMNGGIASTTETYKVELYNGSGEKIAESSTVSVVGETAHPITIVAGANGSVSPNSVSANNAHIHPTITATANTNYYFVNWTYSNNNATVTTSTDPETTIATASGACTITANFAPNQYTITYKDKDNVTYTGTNEGSLPNSYTYGTGATLTAGDKAGYRFDGWYDNPSCTGDAVTTIGTTATGAKTFYAKWSHPEITALSASAADVYSGEGSITLTATRNNDATGINIQYQVKVPSGSWTNIGEAVNSLTKTYSPTDGDGTYWFRAYPVGYSSNYTDASKRVYEHFTIYFDKKNWSGNVKLHEYYTDGNVDYPKNAWGYGSEFTTGHNGSSYWMEVTLDTKYDKIILYNSSNDTERATYEGFTKSDFINANPPYWYWDGDSWEQAIITAPTVRINSCNVFSTYALVEGEVTNFGGDGNSLAYMLDYGIKIGETKYNTIQSTSGGAFRVKVTGLTAETDYTIKAYAENVERLMGESAGSDQTTGAASKTFKVRYKDNSAVSLNIYAYREIDSNYGTETKQNSAWGETPNMSRVTGTARWWETTISNPDDYEYFIVTKDHTSGDGTQSASTAMPNGDACYWYDNTAVTKLGAMDCPRLTTDVYIEETAGGEDYVYQPMSGSGTLTKVIALEAKSTYKFKIYYQAEYLGKTSGSYTRGSSAITCVQDDGYISITTDVAGDYTFTLTAPNTISVTYPTAYAVTFGYGTGGSSVSASAESAGGTFSSDALVRLDDVVTFTQTAATGYNFKEWNTQSDGKGTRLSTSATYNHTVGITNSVYAIYEPASYDITYDPASPTNFAYTLEPTTGVYNSTVSVTIIPAQNYKITSVTAAKTEASGTSVSVTHTTATNVYSFTQPAYGVTLTTTAAAYGLTATATADYVAKTFTLGNTSTLTPEGTKGTNWFVYYTCTAKPDGANCSINQSTGVATVDKIGNYTFKAQFRTADSGVGTLLAESSGNTIEMKDFPDYSGIAPTTAIIGSSYMNGSGISESPYFVYSSHFDDAKTLTLNISGVGESDDVYCAVDGANEQSMTGSGTSRTATITLPSNTIEANKTTAVTVYAKVDGQTAPAAKKATATIYYTVNTDPVVTVTATYNGNPVAGNLPQSATIELAASVTEIPGEPTFTYSKGEGAYTSTTSYTINETGTTTMHAKTTYLGDWIGDFNITTYTANAVTLKTVKTDMYGDNAESSTSRLFNSEGEEYTAPTIEGYTFAGWSCDNSNVQVSDDECSSWKSTSSNATVHVKATSTGGTLTATYNENKRIYFDDRNTNWGSVHVILFNEAVWNNDKGVKVDEGKRVAYGEMTRIGVSNIYYYEYGATTFSYVVFTKDNQYNYSDGLYATKAAYRGDFSTCNPVFVPNATKNDTKNGTDYYSDGYWRRYMPAKSGYTLWFSDQEVAFLPEDPSVDSENFTVTVLRAGTTNYAFNIHNACMSKSWGNTGTMTKDNCSNWTFTQTSGSIGNCNITTTAEGNYVFHLSTVNGQIKVSVDYPLSVGDYRIHYTDNTGNNNNYSDYIRKNTGSEAKKDTVSFFVAKNSTPKYQVEKCNSFDGSGNPEWITVGEAQSLSVDKDGVYIFVFEQPAGGESISKIAQDTYSGNYYIRTDGASGGWANYLSDPDNRMKYTDKASAAAAGYNYYYLRWIGDSYGNSNANVKFTVANDYNSSVSQEMGNDATEGSLSGGQALTGQGANVRFTYHSGTNQMTRTYIGGSAHDADYLVINGSNLQTSSGGAWSGRTAMVDQNDWIYTIEIKAANNATITLESHYNNQFVTILPTEKVLEVGDESYYDLRIIYDYKTNEVVAAYIPSTVSSDMAVDVDIMFIRKAKDNFVTDGTADPTTLTLSGEAKITGAAKTLYGAIEFEKDYVRGEGSYAGLSSHRPQRSTYWISFPFDVKVSDIFGLGDYTETWILQRYRGDERARKGWFLDTPTFWEYILDRDYVLKAGQGYVLSLDCEAIQWPNSRTTQYLYFPSKDKVTDITSVLPSASMTVPQHECSITSPADRTIKDANWNVIGIPGFTTAWGKATADVTVIDGRTLKYFYAWDPATNTLSTSSTRKHQFKFMHSYMIQYYGNIDWSAAEPSPAAQRLSNTQPSAYEFELQLIQGETKADQTYITLLGDERISAGFDSNSDLVKMENANKPNIYTIIGNDLQVAANCLPISDQTTLVPIGVKISSNGEYTFAIPEGTSGVGITLIDNETGSRTQLGLMNYTVAMEKGIYNDRFVLEISPIQQTATGDISSTLSPSEESEKARKVLINGVMYILCDGVIYDAMGKRVK